MSTSLNEHRFWSPKIGKLVRAFPNTPADKVKKMNRKRENRVYFHLTDTELAQLNRIVELTPYRREEFIRQYLFGKEIYERPPAEYGAILKELRIIGSNVYQLLQKAIQTKFVDEIMIQDVYDAVMNMDERITNTFTSKRRKKKVIKWQ